MFKFPCFTFDHELDSRYLITSPWTIALIILAFSSFRCHSARRRRAASYVIFTENQVHILPGYPKQISQDPLLATLAFYLLSPPGLSSEVINKGTLVSIVKGSLAEISSSINGNISRVETLFTETTPTASLTSTREPEEADSNTIYYIIAGSLAGGLLFIILAVIIVCKCSHPKNR